VPIDGLAERYGTGHGPVTDIYLPKRFAHSCCIALRPGHRGPGKLVTTALWLVSIFSAFGALSSTTSVVIRLQGHSLGVAAAGFGVLARLRARSA